LSVVVVAGDQHDRARHCIEHLCAQTALDGIEIIVVDLASTEPAENSSTNHSRVTSLKCSHSLSYGEARAEGARHSHGSVIAFIEDHCYADPRWAEEVLAAFERPVGIVDYAMMASNDKSLIARMFTMCEYGRWMVPAISGPVPISTCQNVAYRRSVLEPYWNTLGQWLDAEPLLCRSIQATGAIVWLAGDARVAHESWSRIATGLHANRTLKRVFAAERANRGAFSGFTRCVWAAAMVLTPPLHILRLVRSLVRRPRLWPLFWISLPLMGLVSTAGAVAEAAGYLFGEGDSKKRFRDLEISIERQI
jgi:glycosyltransferase involved in cell wall biosynthesis